MRTRIERELASMERSLKAVQMSPSERLEAAAALRNGFVIVEYLAWLASKATQIRASLFATPSLAR